MCTVHSEVCQWARNIPREPLETKWGCQTAPDHFGVVFSPFWWRGAPIPPRFTCMQNSSKIVKIPIFWFFTNSDRPPTAPTDPRNMAQSTYLGEYILENAKKNESAMLSGRQSLPNFDKYKKSGFSNEKIHKIWNFKMFENRDFPIFHRLELMPSPLNQPAKHSAIDWSRKVH